MSFNSKGVQPIGSKLPFLGDFLGNNVVRIETVRHGMSSLDEEFVAIECKIVGGDNKVGSRCVKIIKKNPEKKKQGYYYGAVFDFVGAAIGKDISEHEKRDIIVTTCISEDANMLTGLLVNVVCFAKKSKDGRLFNESTFSVSDQDDEGKVALTRVVDAVKKALVQPKQKTQQYSPPEIDDDVPF